MKTPQYRFYMLIAGFLILLIASWNLSISKAFSERSSYKKYEDQKEGIARVEERMIQLQQQEAMLSQELGGSAEVEQGFEEALLQVVGSFAADHRLQLTEFSELMIAQDQNFKIETLRLSLKGAYKDHLRLLNHLESDFKLGTVASVDFELRKNYNNQKEELYQTIFVQNLYEDDESTK